MNRNKVGNDNYSLNFSTLESYGALFVMNACRGDRTTRQTLSSQADR